MSPGARRHAHTSLLTAIVAALLAGSSCRDYDPCEAHVGALCEGTWRLRQVDVKVDDAVSIDVDDDGLREWALLDRDARTVTIAWAEYGRSETYRLDGRLREIAAIELDEDGDGVEDLAVICDGPPRLVPLYVRDGELVQGEPTPLSDTPLSVAVGELDGDDRPELLIGHVGALTVIRGRDLSHQIAEIRGAPVALDLADFDGDGALDVAAINLDGASLEVLRGDGDGGLAAMASVSLGPAPEDLDLADLNGDGAIDVVVRSRLSDLWIVEGDGAGGFVEPWTLALAEETTDPDSEARGVIALPTLGSGTFGVVTPRWPLQTTISDGSQGIVGQSAVLSDRRALVLRESLVAGRGFLIELDPREGPGLLAGATLDLGETRGPIAAGDLDGDGWDEVVALTSDCEVQVFPGQAQGLGPAQLSGALFDRCPWFLELADVAGDERPDLIGGGLVPGGFELYLGVGLEGGGFELADPLLIEDYGGGLPQVLRRPEGASMIFLAYVGFVSPRAPLVVDVDADGTMSIADPTLPDLIQVGQGDVDGDGQDDLVALLTVDLDGGTLGVYYGVDDELIPGPVHGPFRPSPEWIFNSNGELLVEDLDGDDLADVVLLSAGNIATLTGLGGELKVVDAHPVAGSGIPFIAPGTSFSAELDGDGLLDLVRVNRDQIFAVHGTSQGRFAAEGTLLEFPESVRVTSAQLDDDGRSELLVESVDAPIQRVKSHDIGLPALGRFHLLPGGFLGPWSPSAVYGDFDGDGDGDVAAAESLLVTTLWGDGGTFHRSSSREVPSGPYSNYAAADLDGDGRDELLALDEGYISSFAQIDVLRWVGEDWAIVGSVSIPEGLSSAGLLVEDLDGDGVNDLAVSEGLRRDAASTHVYIAYGRRRADGAHELEEPVSVTIAADPEPLEGYSWLPVALSSGDLDGDGRPELLIDGPVGSPLLLWNDGDRRWSPVEVPATSAAIAGVGELLVVEENAIGRIPVYGRRLAEAVMSVHDQPWSDFRIHLHDCNGDGHPDLSVSTRYASQLWFAVSDTFVRPVNVPLSTALHCEDIDGDGVVDLLGTGLDGIFTWQSGGTT